MIEVKPSECRQLRQEMSMCKMPLEAKLIKDAIWKRRNKAIDEIKWNRSDIEKAKLEGIKEGLEIAYYLI